MNGTPVTMTGIKPTGRLHLGNLLGAIRPFLTTQHDQPAVFGVMDLHALTVTHTPRDLPQNTLDVFRLLLACGLDPDHTTVFVQSHVPQHTELHYLLESTAHVGELERQVQYKEKSATSGQDGTRFSLMSYPVLQAADILLYQATTVPVGEDQRQHLELTRTLANRFNRRYGNTFVVPQAVTPTTAARLMDLSAPTGKMGKSNQADGGTLFLLDDEATLRRKISRAVTDLDGDVTYDPERKPGVSNLLALHASLTDTDPYQNATGFTSYADLKAAVTEVVLTTLAPLRAAYARLSDEQVRSVMAHGAARASRLARPVVQDAKRAIGLLGPS